MPQEFGTNRAARRRQDKLVRQYLKRQAKIQRRIAPHQAEIDAALDAEFEKRKNLTFDEVAKWCNPD